MSWCDKLLSVPTVGLRLSPLVLSQDALIRGVAPVLDGFFTDTKRLFEIVQSGPTSLQVKFESGYNYIIDENRLSVSFNHNVGVQPSSGGLPQLEILSEVRPYSELLDECVKQLLHLVELFPEYQDRRLLRVGIVSITTVALDDAPPGVRKFTEYFMRPWKNVSALGVQLVGDLSEAEKWSDRCIYNVSIPEDDRVPQFSFDWQRIFSTVQFVRQVQLSSVLKQCIDSSFDNLEFVAERGLKEVETA